MEIAGEHEIPQVAHISCCICGVVTHVNPANMCPNCIKANVDITEGLIKEYILTYCPECHRYLQPPKYWMQAALESRELLTICLKKIRGLVRYKLIDASFLWTEEHSKHLKVKLVLQQEIFTNTIIQQACQVDFVVQWRQCELCGKAATGQQQWDAVVQVRQRVQHRRTFLFLEQMILKHRMNDKVIQIGGHKDGLDFFFNHRSHALQFVDFVGIHAPTLRRDACQLVSHDSKSNTAVQHHTFSLELSPICREDLVVLPPRLHTQMGGIGPFVICQKIFSSTVFLDPQTLRMSELLGTMYWKNDFEPFATSRQLSEFFINDIRPTGVVNGKMMLAEAEVCLADEVGQGREWCVTTHLGHFLKPGDLAKGYLVDSLNANNVQVDGYGTELRRPDVILVRKHFPNQTARRHKRQWRLKRLDKGVSATLHEAREDFDEFMDDLERDQEFRADIPMYVEHKLDGKTASSAPDRAVVDPAAAAAAGDQQQQEGGDEDDEAVVGLTELMDELAVDPEAEPFIGGKDKEVKVRARDGDDDVADLA